MVGATPGGGKELVGFQMGVRESAQSWRELLVEVKRRGLTIAPEIAVGDGAPGFARARGGTARGVPGAPRMAGGHGAPGFWRAIDEAFPGTRHQRCWLHTIRTQLRIGP